MTRQKAGSIIAGIAAAGFIGTAAIHSTGYDSISRLAKQAPPDLGAVVPALWLAFSLDLCVVGLIMAIIAFRPRMFIRSVLVVAALCPLSAAALQLWFLGFIPPTAILLSVGGLTIIAAGVLPGTTPLN